MGDARVVAAECTEAQLNSGTAEHQKFAGDVKDKFSSPFAFSQAGPECSTYSTSSAGLGPMCGTQGPPQMLPQMPSASPQVDVQVSWQYVETTAPMQAPMFMPPMPMPGCTPGVAPGPVVEGWLSKRAQDMGKTWMNRWFVLNYNGVLSYGKEQASQDKKIFLDKSTRVRPLIHPTATEEGRRAGVKRPFGIEIYQGPSRRTWYLDAGSKEKRDLWLNSLQMVLAQFGTGDGYS